MVDLRESDVHILRRRDLLQTGWTDRTLADAVSEGVLLKPRANAYLPAGARQDIVDACALGGRLACVSDLARRGVFVLDASRLHVHVRDQRGRASHRAQLHWTRLRRAPHPSAASIDPFDSLLLAAGCQASRAVIATLDSALHLGVLHADDLDLLFHVLPRRHRILQRLLDPRAESGPESLMRLILRALGVAFEVQVEIDAVGRVDFVVDGWLIIECDSEAHHSSWDAQRRDRRRDQRAAAMGFATYRPIAEDIMWNPENVRASVLGLLRFRRSRRHR